MTEHLPDANSPVEPSTAPRRNQIQSAPLSTDIPTIITPHPEPNAAIDLATLADHSTYPAALGGSPQSTSEYEGKTNQSPTGVAVVLCALPVEYQSVRKLLSGVQVEEHPSGTLFETGLLPNTRWRIALAQIGEGNIGAAIVAERAAAHFTPNLILFVGVAGALKDDLVVGDIVIATRIYAYAGGKATATEFLARPRSWDAPHQLEQRARLLAATGAWSDSGMYRLDGQAPVVHFKPVAAGEVVVGSHNSQPYEILRQHYNDAVAVEMESGGLAQAAHVNGSLPALTVRGISDSASPKKAELDAAGWQLRAANHAAIFAAALLAHLDPDKVLSRTGRPEEGKQRLGAHIGILFPESAEGAFNMDIRIEAGRVTALEVSGSASATLQLAQTLGDKK